MKLLSIDWDYFFPTPNDDTSGLYDWGRHEAPFFYDTVWAIRAAGFLRAGLPLPTASGEEKTFWNRFHFNPDAKLYTADSHSLAIKLYPATAVWNFDAHHDCGYSQTEFVQAMEEGRVGVGDWLGFYSYGAAKDQVHVRYPRWLGPEALIREQEPVALVDRRLDTGQVFATVFDAVFVCRSSAWVPPWLDQDYAEFLAACPVHRCEELQQLPERDAGAIVADAYAQNRIISTLQEVA